MIFLNYASTSAVKPRPIIEAMSDFYKKQGFLNVHRNAGEASSGEELMMECRSLLARLFNAPDPERIVLCSGATYALNLAIFGCLKPGDQVVTTIYEHNSVLRPLNALQRRGITFSVVPYHKETVVDLEALEKAVTDRTRMIIANHSSNVTGVVLPIREIGEIAKRKKVIFLVDAAQSAGVIDIDVQADNIGLLAFTGHKALYGPTGTGGLYIAPGLDPEPFAYGGTGTFSESMDQPGIYPDKYEAGTPNLIGITGLKEGINFVLERSCSTIYKHEEGLRRLFIEEVSKLPRVRVIGCNGEHLSTAVVSILIEGCSSNEIGEILEKSFGIVVRSGLHCAPLIHRHLGTLESGTVRFSFGYFTTRKEVMEAVKAVEFISRNYFPKD